MTIESLQEIISLEDELFACEQGEQEKAAEWLKKEKAEIRIKHSDDLANLDKQIIQIRKISSDKAEKKAAEIVKTARARAKSFEHLQDEKMLELVIKHIKTICGQ